MSRLKIMVDEKILQQVKEFKYLGSVLTNGGRSEKDIRTRIGMAKSVSRNTVGKLVLFR